MYRTNQNVSKIKFSKKEIIDLLIAIGILTLIFTLLNVDIEILISNFSYYNLSIFLLIVLECFIAAMTGFLLHELAHKFVAQSYQCWAEFRVNYHGLILGVVLAMVGFFVIFLPGAVYIRGDINNKRNGKIAIAGPLTNFIIGGSFYLIYWIIPITSSFLIFLKDLFFFVSLINISLSCFNLIPIANMDGKKVYNWNKLIFFSLFISSIALIIIFYIFGIFF